MALLEGAAPTPTNSVCYSQQFGIAWCVSYSTLSVLCAREAKRTVGAKGSAKDVPWRSVAVVVVVVDVVAVVIALVM